MVVFGEENRGNVYNLFKQIADGKFLMIGNGKNVKSMAYVGNVVAFIEYCIKNGNGEHLFNYVDKPDFDMNTLLIGINKELGRGEKIKFRLPYFVGYAGGLFLDVVSKLTGKKFPISLVRVKKFCMNTMFNTSIPKKTDFKPPFSFDEALKRTIKYEFSNK